MTMTEWKDLWVCPILPLRVFADALGLTDGKAKKFLEAVGAPIFSVGGIDFVKPLEISHAARGWKAGAA